MILSEQQPLMDIIVPKLDSDDEDISFPRRKAKRQASPARNVGVVIEDENNDDDERLARRKSRLLEPHPASANSPCANASTTRRREAAAPRGISQAQIGEHYGNCIRLAAENKITAKNAFNLHLIDYMSDMLKKEDYASFQIASSSLDAGAKIYAGRVDAVHQETYQVLTGLGRSDKLQPTGDEDDENPGDDATGPIGSANIAKDRKKTQVHRDIIQKQLNKIRSKVLAAKADVDPLFQHQTATYNEGGTAELRLNQLCTLDEACVLILDSSTQIMHTSSKPTTNTVNVTGILDFLSPLQPKNISQLHICSSLEDFRFTNWDKGQDWDASTTRPSELQMKSPPITDSGPVDDDDDHSHFADYPQEDNLNDGTLTEEPPEITDKIVPCGSSAAAATATSKEIVPVEKSLDDTPSSPVHTTGTDGELFVSSLKSMLDKQYEHFGQLNDHLLGMWAGPEHWRKKAKRRRFNPITGREEDMDIDADRDANDGADIDAVTVAGKSRKSSRSKKGKPAKLMYLDALVPSENKTRNGHLTRHEWPKNTLSEGLPNTAAANATVFKEQYRQKASRQMNLLPSELADSRQSLYRLFNREVILESAPNADGTSKQSELHPVDAHTNLDPCPAIGWVDGPLPLGSDHDEDPITGHTMDDMDEPPDICISDDDDLGLPFERAFTQPTAAGFTEFGMHGDLELISQPRKVARVEIGYARTAKMINVRHLKTAMWDFLEDSLPNAAARSPFSAASTSSAPEPASLAGDPLSDQAVDFLDLTNEHVDEHASDGKPGSHIPGARCFSELIDSLSSRISWQMAKELSISIALNCLLHLSNEKQLYLECSDNLSDIFISQGLPQFEQDQLSAYAPDDPEANGATKRPPRQDSNRQAKAKRPRPSTLDSWLVDGTRESTDGVS